MAQSLAKILIHIVFSTKNRFPFLTDSTIRSEMHAYLGGICRNLECPSLIVGGVADHIHILSRLSRTIAMADLLAELKRESSKWIKSKGGLLLMKFAWQSGYGAFSIGQREVGVLKEYISRQEEHHRKRTFQEEYRSLLKEFEIEYDERYLWD
ncbi:MAG: IS200/IS605 family transposase [Bacteroidota bacterium]